MAMQLTLALADKVVTKAQPEAAAVDRLDSLGLNQVRSAQTAQQPLVVQEGVLQQRQAPAVLAAMLLRAVPREYFLVVAVEVAAQPKQVVLGVMDRSLLPTQHQPRRILTPDDRRKASFVD